MSYGMLDVHRTKSGLWNVIVYGRRQGRAGERLRQWREAPEEVQTDEDDDSVLIFDEAAEGDLVSGVVIDVEGCCGSEDFWGWEGGGHGVL